MPPPGLRSPREVDAYYDSKYFDLIRTGRAFPFLYPWAGVGALVVLAYLLIDHRRSKVLRWLRWPVFAFLALFQGWCIATNRARNPAASFGVGLVSCWGVFWVASIMIANDCQKDFKRIERVRLSGSPPPAKPQLNGTLSYGNVTAPGAENKLRSRTSATSRMRQTSATSSAHRLDRLCWQTYPSKLSVERIDWIADVFCNLRGTGWNWQTSGVPPLPRWVKARLDGETDTPQDQHETTVSRTGIRRYSDRTALVMGSFQNLVIGFFLLDLIKCLMHRDPYFWGYIEDTNGPEYLPTSMRESYPLLKSYRLLISLAGIYTALWEIFKLGPFFFCGILGPRWIGVRGEPWMNPADVFGSISNILDHGLAGWWGGWWHQTFRFTFEAPTTCLLEAFNLDKKTPTGKAVAVFVAFFLSGCLHACGSYTQLGDTRPLLGPMRFFLLQAVGVSVQSTSTEYLKRCGVLERLPKAVKQICNFVLVHVWLYFTAPLLVDDFARGGVWLYEPLAISPLRGLGFGARDDGWWCWDRFISWRTGEHWWDTGIAP